MSQTTSNGKRRILGSVKVEVAEYGSSTWYDLGLGEGAGFTENVKATETFPDNGASLGFVIDEQSIDVDFICWQPDLSVLKIARGGIDTLTTTAGSAVSGHTQAIASGAWAYNQFISFDGQNGDGTKPTMDVTHPVVGSVDSDLTEVTDFDLVKVSGKWGILVKDSTTVTTTAQVLTLKYSYTPAASYSLSTGGADVPGFLQLRLTNVTSGKNMILTSYKVQNTAGFQVKFNPDNNKSKPAGFVLKFHGVLDSTRTVGDQLYKLTIED
jgi:hypothetical protein